MRVDDLEHLVQNILVRESHLAHRQDDQGERVGQALQLTRLVVLVGECHQFQRCGVVDAEVVSHDSGRGAEPTLAVHVEVHVHEVEVARTGALLLSVRQPNSVGELQGRVLEFPPECVHRQVKRDDLIEFQGRAEKSLIPHHGVSSCHDRGCLSRCWDFVPREQNVVEEHTMSPRMNRQFRIVGSNEKLSGTNGEILKAPIVDIALSRILC